MAARLNDAVAALEAGRPTFAQYDHPSVAASIGEILDICRAHGVACGHPYVDSGNVGTVLEQGFRWLMPAPVRSLAALKEGRRRAGR